MFAIFGLIIFHVILVEANVWQGSGDLYIKLSIASQQPLISGDMATLHVDCRDKSNNKKEIQALTMTFSLPYFLVYQNQNTTSESVGPSSVRNNTGQPVFQFSSLKQSEVISLDIRVLVMRQNFVPDGKESISTGHMDVSYQRGSQECGRTFNTYRDVEILVYNPDCESWGPLGMTDGSIKESQLSVSSIFQKNTRNAGINGPYHTGLHREEYWAPASGLPSHDRRQYIQLDFRSLIDVKMISAQGHPGTNAPIKSLQIIASNDGYRWKDYHNKHVKFYVTTDTSGDALLTAILKMPLTTQWLRISPRFSERLIGFRFEVYGCLSQKHFSPFEDPPLGMESGVITDNQASSSTNMGESSHAANARLNLQSPGAAWCSKKAEEGQTEWLAVDLVTSHVISAVSTQCRYPLESYGKTLFCVYLYRLSSTSSDSDDWTRYKENGIAKVFVGNFQRQTMVKHHLIKPIQTNKIIFIPVADLSEYYCMRVELYGRKTLEKGLESRMVFPDPRSTMNFAVIESAIGSELSKFTLCLFVKMVLTDSHYTHKCVFSYAERASEHANDIRFCILGEKVKFNVGIESRTTAVYLADGRWYHVCITWENTWGEWNIYQDGQLAAQNGNLSISHVVKPGGVAMLGQDQDIVGGGFDLRDAFTGELAQVNLWDVVLSAAEIAAQFKNSYIPHGSVIQWSQFKLVGEVGIRKYIDRPVVYSRAFLVDAQSNRLFVCNTEKSRKKSHCYVTTDGKAWTALNYKLLTILGLDEEGKLHGVYLNGKAFLSCEHNGEGDCNVEPPETWYQARDQPNTITAIEVPIIPETGLYITDLPRSPLIREDSKGRYWGASARGIHLSLESNLVGWKLVLTWRDYDFDECASSNCHSQGTCVIVDYGFVCICSAGWTGLQCEASIDECASNPCKNGATCIDKHLSYICECVDGYTGPFCGTEIDECDSDPCVNGGRCIDKVNSYTCSCTSGYEGINCGRDIDECLAKPCNHGECQNNPGSYDCTCQPGWLEAKCDVQDFCHGHTDCLNGATCKNGPSSYTCQCPNGWEGDHCEKDVDECLESRCGNGTCHNQPGGYSCACPAEWHGSNCGEFVEGCYNNAVGVEDPDSIPDNQMTASSEYNNTFFLPSYGRLNGARGDGWCAEQANGSNDWLQIDFNRTVEVCAVATQGNINGNEWVTDFKMSFSSDGGDWTTYRDANGKEKEFHREGNSATVDKHKLPAPVSAKYIRFHPTKQHNWNCLRVEVYGMNDPCDHHHLLDEPDRRKSVGHLSGLSRSCDRDLIPSTKTWYRFSDISGSQMVTSCIPKNRCNTNATGWLVGNHPSVAQGVVNMKVCFHWLENCCFFRHFISVKNCSSFYSYGIVNPSEGCLRYCGDA